MGGLGVLSAVFLAGSFVLLLVAMDVREAGDADRPGGVRGSQVTMAFCRLVAVLSAGSLVALLARAAIVGGYLEPGLNAWAFLLAVGLTVLFLAAVVLDDTCRRALDRKARATDEVSQRPRT